MPSIEDIQREECASFMYDGGWRAEDKDLMMYEYGISSEEADKICEYLAEFEKKGEQ